MSARELADLLIGSFDRRRVLSVERALAEALRATGVAKNRADGIAFDQASNVLREIRRRPIEELPFRFADSDAERLVGKERQADRDNSETRAARRVWAAADPLLNHLTSISPTDFEVVCAAGLALAGATDMRAICAGDEGGIDFYGRLAVRQAHPSISPGLVYTTILPKPLLVLGQSKRYARDTKIGRPEIQQFKGQVEDCLEKYEGNRRPPSHRVPAAFYDRGEPCLAVFATTGGFSETAEGATASSGIHLLDGMRLAQFLVYHGVGIEPTADGAAFDHEAFETWLMVQRGQLQMSRPDARHKRPTTSG